MKTIHPYTLPLIFIFATTLPFAISTASYTPAEPTVASFVKGVCNSTTYPIICNLVCLPYAQKIKGDRKKMGLYALKVSLEASKKASKTVSKLSKDKKLKASEGLAIKDCIEENKDTISEIKDSLSEIRGDDIGSKLFDIKTEISAAITDLETCLDGLDEENVRPDVKVKITNAIRYVSMLCTNSLAIIGLIQY